MLYGLAVSMTWWYEIRDSKNRLVEIRQGFPTEVEARDRGEFARRTIQDISPSRVLTVLTRESVWRAE